MKENQKKDMHRHDEREIYDDIIKSHLKRLIKEMKRIKNDEMDMDEEQISRMIEIAQRVKEMDEITYFEKMVDNIKSHPQMLTPLIA